MGNNASAEPPQADLSRLSGFHVLKVEPKSPAADAGLRPYFDFIVKANDLDLSVDHGSGPSPFVTLLQESVGSAIKITIYNLRNDQTRETLLTPSRTWGGDKLIGANIRFCHANAVVEYVWHILDVYPNSPASQAGLQPETDYVVGNPIRLFKGADDFVDLVQESYGQPLQLYVYNTKTDDTRVITITPNPKWGGRGCLGCDIGFGLLHRVPTSTPNQSVEEGNVPAASAPAPITPISPHSQQLAQQMGDLRLQQTQLESRFQAESVSQVTTPPSPVPVSALASDPDPTVSTGSPLHSSVVASSSPTSAAVASSAVSPPAPSTVGSTVTPLLDSVVPTETTSPAPLPSSSSSVVPIIKATEVVGSSSLTPVSPASPSTITPASVVPVSLASPAPSSPSSSSSSSLPSSSSSASSSSFSSSSSVYPTRPSVASPGLTSSPVPAASVPFSATGSEDLLSQLQQQQAALQARLAALQNKK
eukprot:CAMPEP_0177634060 /NCGR_PEP_ID=MMETSP0447-20121125/3170_1 /TAXON_ID=0 /ORGANISM="Stygamoeba regulata, Strain BSH-02190019" /LENGTH=476 /DNA_ID=CAMNT_0019135763 /DNA_START=132 /DNA_END=1562 /DNA_ORIENTATION=-